MQDKLGNGTPKTLLLYSLGLGLGSRDQRGEESVELLDVRDLPPAASDPSLDSDYALFKRLVWGLA